MEDAPVYSPTASAGERGRLPHDFQHGISDDEQDPLDSLARPKSLTSAQEPRTGAHGRDGEVHMLRQTQTAPALFEPPPDYAPVDALAHCFRLDAPLVYAAKTSDAPRYQLMQEFTRSGRPKKLCIRRLMAAEVRHHSLPSPSAEIPSPRLRYDEDGTMYTITGYEMKGMRSSTLGGSIRLETGTGVIGGRWIKIFLLTKNARRDSLNPQNEARIQKYGYHADEEWDKRLLFSIKRGIWENGKGKRVAIEEEGEGGRSIDIVDELVKGGSASRRDLLVSCWVMKIWMVDGLRWENDVKGW